MPRIRYTLEEVQDEHIPDTRSCIICPIKRFPTFSAMIQHCRDEHGPIQGYGGPLTEVNNREMLLPYDDAEAIDPDELNRHIEAINRQYPDIQKDQQHAA